VGTSRLDLDDRLGDAIERVVRRHHRRRLARIGQERAFAQEAGGWAESGAFRPHRGVASELLVDGAEALPRIASEI